MASEQAIENGKPKTRFYVYFPLAIALLNLPSCSSLVAGVAGWESTVLPGMAVGVMLWLPWTIAEARRPPEERWFFRHVVITALMLIGGIILPGFVGTKLVDAVVIVSGNVPSVSIADAPSATSAVLAVEGAQVRLDLLGQDPGNRTSSNETRLQYSVDEYAAPVVAPSWKPDSEVAVWRYCSREFAVDADAPAPATTEAACRKQLQKTPIWGRVFRAERDAPLVDAAPDAVKSAMKQHGLSAPQHLLVLEGTSDHWAVRLATIGAFVFVAVNALVLGIIFFLWRPRRAEQASPA